MLLRKTWLNLQYIISRNHQAKLTIDLFYYMPSIAGPRFQQKRLPRAEFTFTQVRVRAAPLGFDYDFIDDRRPADGIEWGRPAGSVSGNSSSQSNGVVSAGGQ